MAIRFDHQAAAVGGGGSSRGSGRKYGLQQLGANLVLQQGQQKYDGQQRNLDRLYTIGQQREQNQFQLIRDERQAKFDKKTQKRGFKLDQRGKQADFEREQEEQEKLRRQGILDDARAQSGRFILDAIENGEFDDVTARELKQNLIAEAEILGNPNLDATQRAEAMQKIRARRSVLLSNRKPKEPPPTPQEEFDKGIVTDPDTGMRYRPNSKGDFEPMEQAPPPAPTNAAEAFRADPDLADKYVADAENILNEGGEKTLTAEDRKAVNRLAQQLWAEDQETRYSSPTGPSRADINPGGATDSYFPTTASGAPADPFASPAGQQPPVAPEQGAQNPWSEVTAGDGQVAPAPMPQRGSGAPPGAVPPVPMPEQGGAPPGEVGPVDMPERGPMPLTSSPSARAEPPRRGGPDAQQQVKVDGRPLAVTPGTLTPQETAAKSQIMELPREDRIKALMPYDEELKGKTLEQILKSPESKAQYKALTEQGLTTGNYRKDMLEQLDTMLQHNVLNAAGQAPPDAYVGMRVDDITDPKAKAELAKLPRPKSEKDLQTSRGRYFIDPEGVIRARS